MKRFPLLVCLALLLLLAQNGIASAETTTTTTTPDRIGGSVFFETDPSGATIWVDNTEVGTSPFLYFSEKTGTHDVFIQKEGCEDFTDKITVIEGRRVDFFALLTPVAHALSEETTTIVPVTTAATTTPDRIGGSVFFDTDPPGATIQVDNTEIGTSPFTYFSEKTGTHDVRAKKKGYEEYTGTVTVEEGRRVAFYARLTPLPRTVFDEETPATPVATATTIRKSTLTVPTPWPTTAQSPVDPAAVVTAVGIGLMLFAIRHGKSF
jgi:hypothetical protein